MAQEATETTETTEDAKDTSADKTAPEKTEDVKPNGEDTTTSTDDWRASIEDAGLRKVADRFDSVVSLTQAVADLRKRESTSIRLPGKDADDKEVAAYRKAIGVPEAAEGYDFGMPEGHEPTDADKAFQASAAEVFHGLNITAEQVTGLSEWWNGYAAEQQQALVDADTAYADQTEAALKKEWPGEEFGHNKAFADRAATKLFGDELEAVRWIEGKDGRFVLDHPAFVKALAQVGREMEEGRLGDVMTDGDRDGVQGQIDDLEKKIDKAKATGDRETANRLYNQQQDLYRKVVGSGAIVGAEGRTV